MFIIIKNQHQNDIKKWLDDLQKITPRGKFSLRSEEIFGDGQSKSNKRLYKKQKLLINDEKSRLSTGPFP